MNRKKVFVIIIIIVLLVSAIPLYKFFKKIGFDIISKSIEYELLYEGYFDPELNEPLYEFEYVFFSIKRQEVYDAILIDYPKFMSIDSEEKEYFEDIYSVDLPDDIQYSEYTYVVFGSEIKGFKVLSRHQDELSRYKIPAYDTLILFDDEYNANKFYIYSIKNMTTKREFLLQIEQE